MDIPGLVDTLQQIGLLGAAIFALLAVWRGWWHTDREFQEERADKLEWKALAMSLLGTAEKATAVAERVVK